MIYEFKCPACGCLWEHDMPMKDEHVRDCPECGRPRVHCIITGGGGFAQVYHKNWNPVPDFPDHDRKTNKRKE